MSPQAWKDRVMQCKPWSLETKGHSVITQMSRSFKGVTLVRVGKGASERKGGMKVLLSSCR